MFRERANAVFIRYRDIRVDLDERKEESKSLRRQFDSIIEYVNILLKFLEKLRSRIAGYEYAIYKGKPNN
jgi:hypothetical protein